MMSGPAIGGGLFAVSMCTGNPFATITQRTDPVLVDFYVLFFFTNNW